MRTTLAILALACLVPLAAADDKPKDPKTRPANHLARESSPYLLQHAHNPVDWYPWGEEAFAKAKKEGKLIFLSIGYSSCHWCHVMERESFSNDDVAKVLNEHFVCIKVDREERPDIDQIYMTALHVTRQRGGWPLSMFLTAEGKPIFGGTYWPREDRVIDGEKVGGFQSVLKRVQDLHTKEGPDLEKQADHIAKMTAEALAGSVRGLALVDPNRNLVVQAVDGIRAEFDPDYGGFGSAERDFKGTKFPTPPYLRLLQYEAARSKPTKGAEAMLLLTLDKMARGGIYDQVGGGFHRYSTERTWTVPHFEKMLYDNGQLVEVYADAYRRDPKPLYKRVIEETLAFVTRELTHPEGGFYSALDADSEEEEGRFYVWTGKEIDTALEDKADADLIKKVYGVHAGVNFEGKYHIFVLTKPLSERAEDLKMTEEQLDAKLTAVKKKLFEVRSKRPRPLLDTKVLTGWNGEMIAGYALAGEVLKEPKYTAAAAKAADFVLTKLRTKDGRLMRTYGAAPGGKPEAKLNGCLDDYAYFAHGLLCLHDATNDRKWLDEAKKLTDLMVKHHHDSDQGGFFYTSHDHEKLFARGKDMYDGAQPSGNSLAARNLVRLWIKTKDEEYRKLADRTFRTFATQLDTRSTALATMSEALAMFLDAEKAKPKEEPKKEPECGPAEDEKKEPPQKEKPKEADKESKYVKVTATAEKPDKDNRQIITVKLEIEKGWLAIANPPIHKEMGDRATRVLVRCKEGFEEVRVEYPKGKRIKVADFGDYDAYEGTATIKVHIRRAAEDRSPVEVGVRLSEEDNKSCMLPHTVWVKVP